MPADPDSVFTEIIAGRAPADIVFENARVLAFRDIAPRAPVHLLVIPKVTDYADVVELAAGDPALLAEIVAISQTLAAAHSDGDFRLVFNTGPASGQTVRHVHAHVLAAGPTDGSLTEDTIGMS